MGAPTFPHSPPASLTAARARARAVHNHSAGECWLKRQADPTRPRVGDSGAYPPELRAAPRDAWPWKVELNVWPWPMPAYSQWASGVLLSPEKGGAKGAVTPGEPANLERWCARNRCASRPDAKEPAA